MFHNSLYNRTMFNQVLNRHKNVLFARLFKPFGTRALQSRFSVRSQSRAESTKLSLVNKQSLLHLSGQIYTK